MIETAAKREGHCPDWAEIDDRRLLALYASKPAAQRDRLAMELARRGLHY